MPHRRLRIFVLASIVLLLNCQHSRDALDAIKKFHPEDKYFKANVVSLHFRIETSQIAWVDTVFRQTVSNYQLPVDAVGCKDGVYVGESPYDAYDYKHVVKIKIKDQKIVSVDYDEIKKNGKGKQDDAAYCEEMSVTGTTPAIAYPIYEKQLVDKQNVLNVDGVSGASYSLYRFRYAVIVALIKARLAEG